MFSDYFEEYKNSNVCINPYDQEKLAREEREYFAEEARKEGRQEGIEENTVKTIKAMLKEGLDENMISKITGHTLAEINNLK